MTLPSIPTLNLPQLTPVYTAGMVFATKFNEISIQLKEQDKLLQGIDSKLDVLPALLHSLPAEIGESVNSQLSEVGKTVEKTLKGMKEKMEKLNTELCAHYTSSNTTSNRHEELIRYSTQLTTLMDKDMRMVQSLINSLSARIAAVAPPLGTSTDPAGFLAAVFGFMTGIVRKTATQKSTLDAFYTYRLLFKSFAHIKPVAIGLAQPTYFRLADDLVVPFRSFILSLKGALTPQQLMDAPYHPLEWETPNVHHPVNPVPSITAPVMSLSVTHRPSQH